MSTEKNLTPFIPQRFSNPPTDKRKQISLRADEHAALKALADEVGVSIPVMIMTMIRYIRSDQT